jgi:N-acetylneuraminic acid mutarotase
VVADGRVYVIGGYGNGGAASRLEVCDTATGAWTEGPPARHPRNLAVAAAIGNDVYVIGGLGEGQSCVSTMEVYRPAIGEWMEFHGSAESCRVTAAAAAIGGLIYVFGGRQDRQRTVDVYDPSAGAWTSPATLPAELGRPMGAVVTGGRIVVVDEHTPGFRAEAFVFDPSTARWTTLKLPDVLVDSYLGIASVGGRLVVIDGGNPVRKAVPQSAPGLVEPLSWICHGLVRERVTCTACWDEPGARGPADRWIRVRGEAKPDMREAARTVDARIAATQAARRGSPAREPWIRAGTVCYGAPGGRFPQLGRDGVIGEPPRRRGRLVPW